jgi:pectate lyase
MLTGKLHRVWRIGIGLTAGWLVTASAQQPAFPGAEGFGAFASGGRSGAVYHVTNLNNSGSGSFRDAVSQPNRTIVFDVSGIINIPSNQPISITRSNITVAGQTAPGDGITTRGGLLEVNGARNVIVRFLHCRPGDTNCPNYQDDSFHVVRGTNVIVDHVSGSWCNDEVLSVTHFSTNVTIQWCVIAEPLNLSCHVEGGVLQEHGYGTLIRFGGAGVTFHHNLYAHNKSRNPRLGDNYRLDWVNNVIYNWGDTAGYNANDNADTPGFVQSLNYVNNYLIVGTNTTQNPPRAFKSDTTISNSQCQIYQSGNLIDTNRTGPLAGFDKGWANFTGNFTTNLSPFPAPPVTTDTASNAYVRVLSWAGASVVRDAVDARVVSNVLTKTGKIINSQNEVGGWPAMNSLPAPLDTDQDGMPDFWEAALGSGTNNAADRNDLMPDGYTRLEWYLNWLAAPHARVTNAFVEVDLLRYTAGLIGPTFTTPSASNGAVTLLGDGHTARFTPNNGFSGLGNFQFVGSASGFSLTGAVSVLVSPGATPPPLTPFEQWQLQYFGSTNSPAADASADPDGDGQTNLAEFQSGTNPTNNLSALRIVSVTAQANDIVITWQTVGGRTNAVQAATGGDYTNNLADISGNLIITGSGDVTTNYTDTGGATNVPARFYRVRVVP